VLIFGKDSGEYLVELLRIKSLLVRKGYKNAKLLKLIEDIPNQSLTQRLRVWGLMCRFSIIVDRKAAGHLSEFAKSAFKRIDDSNNNRTSLMSSTNLHIQMAVLMLDELGANEEQLKDFIRHLDVHCFRWGLTPDEFMNLVEKISTLSDNFGSPVEELPGCINRAKTLLNDINLHTRDLIINQERVTMTDLEEYRRNRPLVDGSIINLLFFFHFVLTFFIILLYSFNIFSFGS
jgi:hypothetical protein